jgi:hypothetical protein
MLRFYESHLSVPPSLFAFKYCTSIELILTSLIRSFKRDKAAGEVVDDDD